jgi:hypothetical protein
MKTFTKFTAFALVLVAIIASTTFAVNSPYGRYGLRSIDPGEDHPWGGDQIISDQNPFPSSDPIVSTSSTVIITGQTWLDIFINRLFYHPGLRRTVVTPQRPAVTPVTPSTSLPSTTNTGSGSSN